MTHEQHVSGESQPETVPRAVNRAMKFEGAGGSSTARYWGMDETTFSMLLHLSSFMSLIVPFAGIVLPIVMWATNKNQSPTIDAHGKNVINWLISFIIYGLVSAVLFIVLIGIPMLIALCVCSCIFTIMGAVKANNNTVWKYPMSIRFIK